MKRRVYWLRAVVVCGLVLNLLDLTTSLVPAEMDRARPPAPRSLAAWVVQLALLAPLLALVGPRARPFVARVRALPVPRPALFALGAFVLVELAHIALRAETYPFSCVGMFSTAVPEWQNAPMIAPAYLVADGQRVVVLNFMREGNPFLARYFQREWDYKAAWVMRQYGAGSRVARGIVARRLAERALPPPALADVAVSGTDGRMRLVVRGGP
jgi:hypothetical protein